MNGERIKFIPNIESDWSNIDEGKIGEEISRSGKQSVVYEYGENYIIKVPIQKDEKASQEILSESKKDLELLQEFIPKKFIPETHFVTNKEDQVCTIQERINGVPIKDVNDEILFKPEIKKQLLEFIKGAKEMYGSAQKRPDLFGRPLKWFNSKMYSPRYTDNLFLTNEEKIVLTDVGSVTYLSEKKGLHHNFSTKKLGENLDAFESWLDKSL